MKQEKYKQAIDLLGDKYVLPDFAYPGEHVRENIRRQKDQLSNILMGTTRQNSMIIPFSEIISKSLPNEEITDRAVHVSTGMVGETWKDILYCEYHVTLHLISSRCQQALAVELQ